MLLCDVLTWQTSMSVQILNFQRDVTKNVTTYPVVSTACVKMATSSMAKSTAWVRRHSFQLQYVKLNCNNVMNHLKFDSFQLHQTTERYSCMSFMCVQVLQYVLLSHIYEGIQLSYCPYGRGTYSATKHS